jgi:hypothetical protein
LQKVVWSKGAPSLATHSSTATVRRRLAWIYDSEEKPGNLYENWKRDQTTGV